MSQETTNRMRYLDVAYEIVDGSPKRSFHVSEVERKLGLDDETRREVRRFLEDRGLLASEGADEFRLRVPAIHEVEEWRLEEGQDELVDERREERGTYLRTLYEVVDGDTTLAVSLDEVQEELELDGAIETRTREYLTAAGLVASPEDGKLEFTETGAEWAKNA